MTNENVVVVQTAVDLLLGGLVDRGVAVALVVEDEVHTEVLGDHGVALVEGVTQHVALHALHHKIVHAIVADEDGKVTVELLFFQLLVGGFGGGLVGGTRLSAVATLGGVVGGLAAGDGGEEQAHGHEESQSEGEDAFGGVHD